VDTLAADQPDRLAGSGIEQLRQALTDRGWTGQDLVDHLQKWAYDHDEGTLGLTRSYVSEWLNGKRGISRPYARRISAVVGIPADHFVDRRGNGSTSSSSDAQRPKGAPLPGPRLVLTTLDTLPLVEKFTATDMAARREALAAMATLHGSALLAPVRHLIFEHDSLATPQTRPTIEERSDVQHALQVFRRWDAQHGGSLQRKAVVGQLRGMTEARSAKRSQLFMATIAEFSQLAGWMAYDSGLYGLAQRYLFMALRASVEAADSMLGAKIIGDMAQLSNMVGNHSDGLELARTALYSLPWNAHGGVRAELHGLEARSFAELGKASHALRSIEACLEAYRDTSGALPDWGHYLNQAEVDCFAANAFISLALHEPNRRQAAAYARSAERYTLSAQRSRTELFVRSRVFDMLRLAKVRLAQGEPEEGVRVAANAIWQSQDVRSSLIAEWLVQFNSELSKRHGEMRETAEFRAKMHSYVGSTPSEG
jgi:transcriptional regulator with XRE-family HTH domain